MGTALLITNSGRLCVLFPWSRIHINKLGNFQHLLLSCNDKDGVLKHTPPHLLCTTPSPGTYHPHSLRQSSPPAGAIGQIKKLYSTSSVLTSAEHRESNNGLKCFSCFQSECVSMSQIRKNLRLEHQFRLKVWIHTPLPWMSRKIGQIMQLHNASMFPCKRWLQQYFTLWGFMKVTASKHTRTLDNTAVRNYTK